MPSRKFQAAAFRIVNRVSRKFSIRNDPHTARFPPARDIFPPRIRIHDDVGRHFNAEIIMILRFNKKALGAARGGYINLVRHAFAAKNLVSSRFKTESLEKRLKKLLKK